MGLDIYFNKANRGDWERFQNDLKDYENLPKDEQTRENSPYRKFSPEEVGYFRKVNFLMSYFDYEGNCDYKEIPRERLQALRDACAEIAEMKQSGGNPGNPRVTGIKIEGVKTPRVSDINAAKRSEV